jgi:hypothetical protein
MKTFNINVHEDVAGVILAAVLEQYVVLDFRLSNAVNVPKVFKDQMQRQKSLLKNASDAIDQALDESKESRVVTLN